jgi:hypothetical protein
MQFSPAICHFIPLQSRHTSQHPIFKHLHVRGWERVCMRLIGMQQIVTETLLARDGS